MFTEKSRLTNKRENPFYGSYKEKNVLEEIHWQNKKKRRQLGIVTAVIISLTLLAIGIILAITLPPMIEKNSSEALSPVDPTELLLSSNSVLRQHEVAGVSSEDGRCSEIGRSILETRNGSVVDSAIAVVLCLGVVSPQSSGLGGGLFMTVYSSNKMYSLNARETAPEDVEPEAFSSDPTASKTGGLAVGVPSELAGLFAAHQKFGKVPWSELVSPATALAKNGFTVSPQLEGSLKQHQAVISRDAALRAEFFNTATGQPWVAGDNITRPRLGRTLESLGSAGEAAFYNGTIAMQIVAEIGRAGGVITEADLSSYRAEWVESIVHSFENNLTMFSLPFPSSGPVVAMALSILEGYGKQNLNDFTPKELGIDFHRLVETLKFVDTHRAQIGDPNFDDDDTLLKLQDKMLSQEYITEIRSKIHDYQTYVDPAHYGAVHASVPDSGTAHVSIIANGDAVSLTTTINTGFGAGFMGNETGLIYNNEMNDFSFPNKTGEYGLSSNPSNFVEAGKQPASSMCPLIFLNAQGHPVLATGGSGGLNILPAVISATWRALYRSMDIKAAIDYPRFATRFDPIELLYEYGIPAPMIDDLHRKGHHTRRLPLKSYVGNVNSVCRTKRTSKILSNADFRKLGDSAGF